MSVPPESIEAGKCYVTEDGQVRRILSIKAAMVTYEVRGPQMVEGKWPRRSMATLGRFAADVERLVLCNFEPGVGAASDL